MKCIPDIKSIEPSCEQNINFTAIFYKEKYKKEVVKALKTNNKDAFNKLVKQGKAIIQ